MILRREMPFIALEKKFSPRRSGNQICLLSKSQGWGKTWGVGLVCDIDHVNYFEWVPGVAFRCVDFAQEDAVGSLVGVRAGLGPGCSGAEEDGAVTEAQGVTRARPDWQ